MNKSALIDNLLEISKKILTNIRAQNHQQLAELDLQKNILTDKIFSKANEALIDTAKAHELYVIEQETLKELQVIRIQSMDKIKSFNTSIKARYVYQLIDNI